MLVDLFLSFGIEMIGEVLFCVDSPGLELKVLETTVHDIAPLDGIITYGTQK